MATKHPRLKELEEWARRLGRTLKERLPPNIGFTLFLFHFGEESAERPNFLHYISTGRREDMYRTIFEFLEKEEYNLAVPKEHRQMINKFRSSEIEQV